MSSSGSFVKAMKPVVSVAGLLPLSRTPAKSNPRFAACAVTLVTGLRPASGLWHDDSREAAIAVLAANVYAPRHNG
jgi:hypothetical protein